MQRYFIYFSYDGTRYHGWQKQPNGITVQECLEQALSMLLRRDLSVVGAGRTDTGVHARTMVAHFDLDEPAADPAAFCDKLNRILPPDIAVYKMVPVRADAHSRFDALSRKYHYYLVGQKSPFEERYAWRYRGRLDFEAMNRAAERLFDYTDFTSFSKLHTDVKTNNCRIMEARWIVGDGGRAVFVIQADRFLRNMVRAVVGTLLEVGRGKIPVDEFCRIIERKNRCAAGVSVPGHALFLEEITYPDDIFEI
ncbi:MAG: tRNA pseudouridine(38-40) synthase TruA [Coprobacter sp.]|nr:tRNA pseudouridine(38-40) synthase TruA [Coprobacter sp.]